MGSLDYSAGRGHRFEFYENTALRMYRGLARRMAADALSTDAVKRRTGELFRQALASAQAKP